MSDVIKSSVSENHGNRQCFFVGFFACDNKRWKSFRFSRLLQKIYKDFDRTPSSEQSFFKFFFHFFFFDTFIFSFFSGH